MIEANVSLADVRRQVSCQNGRFLIGDGLVRPFQSRHLRSSFESVRNETRLWVGEEAYPLKRADGQHLVPSACKRITDFEGILLVLHQDECGDDITVWRTAAGSCPIYVSSCDGRLAVSWKFEDAVALVRNAKFNEEACEAYLRQGPAHVRKMVVDGIFMLWPGEALSFSERGLQFDPADDLPIAVPGALTYDADVTGEFYRLIGQSMCGQLARSDGAIVELSGGLDSSCVAVAGVAIQLELRSYGLIHDGAMGLQQRARRRELLAKLELDDFEYSSGRIPPFAALMHKECQVTPFDDNHRLPCVMAVDAHPSGIPDLVLTGVGGDELTLEHTYLRREHEIAGNIPVSGIVTATARADMFMRRGIWPKNPLLAQDVVDFCRALPAKLRKNRVLNRLALARFGMSDGFLFPRYTEHYGIVMQNEAALIDFDELLGDSLIRDAGFSSAELLLQEARDASYGGFSYDLIMRLWNLVKLEVVLRRYLT